MCHAIPLKLIERSKDAGIAECNGLKIEVNLSLLPEAKVGDLLLVHVGIALSIIDNSELVGDPNDHLSS